MLGEIAVLNRIGREPGTWRQLFGVEFPAASPRGAPIARRTVPSRVRRRLRAAADLCRHHGAVPRPAEIYPDARELRRITRCELGRWSGRPESMDGVYLDALKLDDYLMADYTDPGGPGRQSLHRLLQLAAQGRGRAFPALLSAGRRLADAGLRPAHARGIRVAGRPLRVNRTLIELGDQRELVYYWFQQRGRVITNEFAVKWYLFWDALTRHRTDGALVRLITPVPPGSDEAAADRRLTEIAARIAPSLPRYVPN